MEIINLALDKLHPYENNPRNNASAVEPVANSIKEFGFKVPIVATSDGEIINGHTRYKAAKKLGLEVVPVIVADDLTEEQIRAFRLADNKTAEIAEWDLSRLSEELELISGLDMSLFGFDLLSDDEVEIEEDDFELDEPDEPKAKLGDIYQLGQHRLMCGDSTDVLQIKQLVGDESIDLLVTDPPYNVAYQGGTEDAMTILNDSMDNESFRKFLIDAFAAADSVLKPGGVFYIWHADSEGYNFRGACADVGWEVRQCLIWNKNSLVMGRQDYQWKHEPCLYGWKSGAGHYFVNDRTLTTIIENVEDLSKMTKAELIEYIEMMQENSPTTIINEAKPTRNGIHPTMKPLKLIERLVKNSSKPNDKVLDSFNGGGSTLMVCEQLGRRYFGMELDPRYVDATIARWEEFTGERAMKIN